MRTSNLLEALRPEASCHNKNEHVRTRLSLQPAITSLKKKGRRRKELSKQWLQISSVLLPHTLPRTLENIAIRDNTAHGSKRMSTSASSQGFSLVGL